MNVTFDVAPSAVSPDASKTNVQFTFHGRRARWVFLVVLTSCLLLLGRAFYLQGWRGENFRALAERNRTRVAITPAPRGVVYDVRGEQLVENVPAFRLFLSPALLPEDREARKTVLVKTAEITSIAPTEMDLVLAGVPDTLSEAVLIPGTLTYEQAMSLYVASVDLPGVEVRMYTERSYRAGEHGSLSHVLGYTGLLNEEEYETKRAFGYRRSDTIGKLGVERAYEDVLRGKDGTRMVEVNSFGREIAILEETEPLSGKNIALSLDAGLQEYAESRLAATLQVSGKKKGAIVILDPRSGGIRALVSLPAYDNNAFASGITSEAYRALAEDENHPLFPRAVAGTYPPGSTFKPFVAATALQEQVIDTHTSFLSTGGLRIGEWFFPDWKAGGHGVTDVRKAIAESVNTFFYIVGGGFGDTVGLGIERIVTGARQFGFGSVTGIDLPLEADGFLPSKEWKEATKGERWYVGDTYHAAIGQGDIAVSPLQIAVATSVLANGGTLYQPTLLETIDGGAERVVQEPRMREKQVFSPEAIETVRLGMRDTVTGGSARSLSALPISVAGKTGTAQAGGNRSTHAWFTSFAPFENPELVVTVLIEEGGEGSSAAVPVARDIYMWWAQHRR